MKNNSTVSKPEFLDALFKRVAHIPAFPTKVRLELCWDLLMKAIAWQVGRYGWGFRMGSLGQFEVVSVPERTKRHLNPHTKEFFVRTTPAHKKLRFRVAKAFKKMTVKPL